MTTEICSQRLTSVKKAEFIEHYKNLRYITDAAEATGIDRRTYYDWREKDPEFCKAIEQADQHILEHYFEKEIDRRAVEGINRPLSYQGKLTGDVVKEYSDNLLMFRTKALAPEKYRDNPKLEVSGQVAHTYNITIQGSDKDRAELERTIAGELIEGEFTTEGD